MEEEKKETADPAATPKEEAKAAEPTLKSMNEKLDGVLKENENLRKQVANNSRIHAENQELKTTLEKVTTSLAGKSEKQKDAILDGIRTKLINKGYDPQGADDLIEVASEIAEKKARESIIPVIIESAQDLVESDPEIDKEFLDKNSDEITAEYNIYKTEQSPRKIKANLKKAYKIVKERLADKAKGGQKDNREEMLEGGKPPASPKKSDKDSEKEFIDSIVNAGGSGGHFI